MSQTLASLLVFFLTGKSDQRESSQVEQGSIKTVFNGGKRGRLLGADHCGQGQNDVDLVTHFGEDELAGQELLV